VVLKYQVLRCSESFRRDKIPIGEPIDDEFEALKAAKTAFDALVPDEYFEGRMIGPGGEHSYIAVQAINTEQDDGGSPIMDTNGRWSAHVLDSTGRPRVLYGHERRRSAFTAHYPPSIKSQVTKGRYMLLAPYNASGRSSIEVLFSGVETRQSGWVCMDDYGDFDEFKAEIMRVTGDARSVTQDDQESEFGIKFSQLASLENIWDIHQTLCEIPEGKRDAFGTYLASLGGLDALGEAIERFEDVYIGRFKSLADFAWNTSDIVDVPWGFDLVLDETYWEHDYWISDDGHVFHSR
jgi:hypothetical protein